MAPAAPQTQLQVWTRRRAQAQVQAVWRARALRYVLIYLLMACVLVTLRYQARAVYPNLHRLNATLSELQHRQSELSLTVQSLTSEQRVRTWALEHGMVPYAQASKQMKTFEAGVNQAPALPVRPVPASVTVRTVWR
ncbi:hypothetical protein [Deinococcus sp.]|uniref:hypothetical protein n=1 Tax=Deinococcus sp. TaxID=47478 RepID=UPI003C7BD9C9